MPMHSVVFPRNILESSFANHAVGNSSHRARKNRGKVGALVRLRLRTEGRPTSPRAFPICLFAHSLHFQVLLALKRGQHHSWIKQHARAIVGMFALGWTAILHNPIQSNPICTPCPRSGVYYLHGGHRSAGAPAEYLCSPPGPDVCLPFPFRSWLRPLPPRAAGPGASVHAAFRAAVDYGAPKRPRQYATAVRGGARPYS